MAKFPKHFLSISDLTDINIAMLFEKAEEFVTLNRTLSKKTFTLKGTTLINLFFENSTRTRTSFELAGKMLGADVVNISASTSSTDKGESLTDTALTLAAMNADFITIRHPESGSAKLIARHIYNGDKGASVINAGDGSHEHPTQALLDALTITRAKGAIKGLVVAICGDILHSRVARSNASLLTRLGAEVRFITSPTLMPAQVETLGVKAFHDMRSGLKDADIIMMLRVQKERMKASFIPSQEEYFYNYGLDYTKLRWAKEDALVMHPGPMNRGMEIDTNLADDLEKTLILNQVEMGVAVRQAVLVMLARERGNA